MDWERDNKDEKHSWKLIKRELLLQLGIAEMQKELLQEYDQYDFREIRALIEQKTTAIKNAVKYFYEGDMLLFHLHLNHSQVLKDELDDELNSSL